MDGSNEPQGSADTLDLAVQLSAGVEKGDNVALASLARRVAEDPERPEAERALARQALADLAPDRLALAFFAGALVIWIVAFTLGIVARHG